MTAIPSTAEILILGGGISGLAVARRLAELGQEKVVVLEREAQVGGMAASLPWQGVPLDQGSHRIHSSFAPAALDWIRGCLGGDLRPQTRRGAIRVGDRFLPYPPSLLTIGRAFGARQSLRFLHDLVRSRMAWPDHDADGTFEGYLRRRVGDGLFGRFYEPYARKLWGIAPTQLSYEPAAARLHRLHIGRRSRRRTFFYPRGGMGRLPEALAAGIAAHGGAVVTGAEVTGLATDAGGVRVGFRGSDGRTDEIRVRRCISTLPLRVLWRLAGLPADGLALRWRALRIVFLLYPEAMGREIDTYYLPDPRWHVGRVSAIGRFDPALPEPAARVLTAELPCSEGDEVWSMPEDQAGNLAHRELVAAGVLPAGAAAPVAVHAVRLADVYPIHELGWRQRWAAALARLAGLDGLSVVGRSALFLHCNIDHCMIMAERLCQRLRASAPADWRGDLDAYLGFPLKE